MEILQWDALSPHSVQCVVVCMPKKFRKTYRLESSDRFAVTCDCQEERLLQALGHVFAAGFGVLSFQVLLLDLPHYRQICNLTKLNAGSSQEQAVRQVVENPTSTGLNRNFWHY